MGLMILQHAESFTVSEPISGGKDAHHNDVETWSDPLLVKDATIYRAPVEVLESGRNEKRVHKARITLRRWVNVSEYAVVRFDGFAWDVTQPPRKAKNPYTGSESFQLAVSRVGG